jgi:hypothetical protein
MTRDADAMLSEQGAMKALTLTQPWASFVALGWKKIETRSWATAYRGPLAIHAAKGLPKGMRLGDTLNFVQEDGRLEWMVTVERDRSGLLIRSERLTWPYRCPIGAIVATCYLTGVLKITRGFGVAQQVQDRIYLNGNLAYLTPEERAMGDYGADRYAWTLTKVEPIKPVQAKGALGLWTWEREAVHA